MFLLAPPPPPLPGPTLPGAGGPHARLYRQGSVYLQVATDGKALEAFAKAVVERKQAPIKKLYQTDRMFDVENAVQVQVLRLNAQIGQAVVTILEGNGQGRTGFVPSAWVTDAAPRIKAVLHAEGKDPIMVVTDEMGMKDLAAAAKEKDVQDILFALSLAGKLIHVGNNVPVKILHASHAMVQLQVLAGPYKGRSGWVIPAYIRVT